MAARLAFIGMGTIGQGITRNLVAKGQFAKPLIIYNRTKSRAEEQSTAIGQSVVVQSLSEVVSKADIIWSCVQNHEAVTEIFGGLLAQQDIRGKLFVESSTIPPEVADDLEKRIRSRGAEFVYMPVFGESTVALTGNLLCVPAGKDSSVDRLRPFIIGVVGRAMIDLSGHAPSKAAMLKLIGNTLIVSTIGMVAEANVFAEKAGIEGKHIQELIDSYTKVAPPIYSKMMQAGAYYNHEVSNPVPTFLYVFADLDLLQPIVEMVKALKLSTEVNRLAESFDMEIKGYQVGVQHMAVAQDHAGPKCDITSIYGAVRLESGLPFENQDK